MGNFQGSLFFWGLSSIALKNFVIFIRIFHVFLVTPQIFYWIRLTHVYWSDWLFFYVICMTVPLMNVLIKRSPLGDIEFLVLDKNVVGLGKMEIVDREGASFSNNCEDKAFLFTYLKGQIYNMWRGASI